MIPTGVHVIDVRVKKRVAGDRDPVGELGLDVVIVRQFEVHEHRRLQRHVAGAEALGEVAHGEKRFELEGDLHQLAVDQHRLGAEVHVGEARRGAARGEGLHRRRVRRGRRGQAADRVRIEVLVGHFDKSAESAGSRFRIQADSLVIDRPGVAGVLGRARQAEAVAGRGRREVEG